jgi:tetratricopeptide (TPR) repeat protein
VFDIQAKVAESVAQAMRVRLSGTEKEALASRPTNNAAAYDYYLRGISLASSMTTATGYLRGSALLQRAVELDPHFALAYAWRGIAELNAYWYRDNNPHRLEIAKAAIDKALSLDPASATGYVALANYYYRGLLDYARALEALDRAQKLAPNDPDAWNLRGLVHRRQGKYEEALAEMARSTHLDPRNEGFVDAVCETQILTRRYDDAEKTCGRLIELEPEKLLGYAYVSRVLMLRSGDVKRALEVLKEAEQRVDPKEFKEQVMPDDSRKFWPSITDADLLRLLTTGGAPSGMDGTPGYLASRVMLALYTKDRQLASTLADSVIAVAPRSLNGTFFDSELHADLALAYAVAGDRERVIAEGKLSMAKTPVSVDALRAARNLEMIARSEVVVGAYDEAVATLEEVLSIPADLSVAELRVDPWFDPLRKNPRFQKLVASSN